jgi:hypothetical protein
MYWQNLLVKGLLRGQNRQALQCYFRQEKLKENWWFKKAQGA